MTKRNTDKSTSTNSVVDVAEMTPASALALPYVTRFSEDDLYFFNEGNHYRLYEHMGSHPMTVDGIKGVYFAVWAPNAAYVAVIGDFNGWNRGSHPLKAKGASGIWEIFIPDLQVGALYKYFVASRYNGYESERADPYGFHHETPPRTASVVWDMNYTWGDQDWMAHRAARNNLSAPISVYEVHIGSWMRLPEEGNRALTYREMAPRLASYVNQMGFTHVEFLPIMEHPFYGSWGYQTSGYFAPTSRFGTPQDFMYLVDYLHQHGIGVILDWVPSHFPSDGHSLGYFDGTHLYEHAYREKGWHPDWNSYIFNYGRHEIRAFLLSSAIFWLDKYHIDGLRVDAVASMLYLDYSRKAGEWMPNQYGSNENLEAIYFLRRMNEVIYERFPDVQTIAEESTSWSMVSRPTYVGGLGFGMKWDMGWMHDTLNYMSHDPVFRRYHQNDLTFRMLYAYHENFMLPLSHDEVVHGKGALLNKMPGDIWQKFANLRVLFGYMFAQSGKKLLFMGGEIGQWDEWSHEQGVQWFLLDYPFHQGMQRWVSDLNRFYRTEPAMHELDTDPRGFEWIDVNDWEGSTITLLRRGKSTATIVVGAFNFTPVPREDYWIGVPCGGYWREVLNSDAREYEGSGFGNAGGVMASEMATHGRPFTIRIKLPPLGGVFFINNCPAQPRDM
ncbi:MAG: 1,4-alpha-glucan branching protein GlgB [Chloroflexaceae bacterium]|nr:1,4-alpha-glucan branching protein GlgB [Chloroflexaceae bacterium]